MKSRINKKLLHIMEDKGAILGLATMCIDLEQGIGTLFESV
jgi:acetyl-CoA acetyltransferase